MSYVESATRAISPFLRKNSLMILESTSPIGTTERIYEMDYRRPTGVIGNNKCLPIVLKGYCLVILSVSLLHDDRIIGGITKEASVPARELYKSFCSGNIFLTDAKTARNGEDDRKLFP